MNDNEDVTTRRLFWLLAVVLIALFAYGAIILFTY